MYQVEFTRNSFKDFKKLDKKYQELALSALYKLAENPQAGKPLKGKYKGYWGIRFSRYRIVYKIVRKRLLIIVFRIGHRRPVYRI